MSEVQVLAVENLSGTFIETAFSAEQVARTLLEESRVEVQENECAFLFPVNVNAAQQA